MDWNHGITRRVRLALVPLMVTVLCVAMPTIVQAATITVNTTTDALHGSGGSGCTTGGLCSLRDAVIYANTHNGTVITLPSGLYKLTIPPNNTFDGTAGHLILAADMTINGAGASTTTVDGGSIADGIFFVTFGTVTLNGMTMANGKTSQQGGAIGGYPGVAANVTDCVFDHNSAIGAPAAVGVPGNFAGGGAISINDGSLVVVRSVFTNNIAVGGKGGFANGASKPGGLAAGGAIEASPGNVITLITDSTFSGNSAVGGEGGAPNTGAGGTGGGAEGGAIALAGTNGSIRGTTFVNNSAVGGPGAVGAAEFIDGTPGGAGGISYSGAIYIDASNADISNSTFVSNSALGGTGGNGGAGGFGYQQGSGGAGGGAYGGAISVQTNGASITNVTIDGNGTTGGIGGVGGANTHGAPGGRGVGGIYTFSTDTYVTNSILSGNGGGNCDFGLLHGGHNLYFDPSTGCGDTAPIFGNPGLTPTRQLRWADADARGIADQPRD